jgi:hypothetical protein
MDQKDRLEKKLFEEKILEYKAVAAQDLNNVKEDKKKKVEKIKYLNSFRDENKQVCYIVDVIGV